jgi:hypothetical protein
VTGEKKKDKAAKVATARNLWVPAVNNHGAFGRWAFIEIDDPSDAANLIRTQYGVRSGPVIGDGCAVVGTRYAVGSTEYGAAR